MIKIYGSPASSAGRCYWMLEELSLPYQQMPLSLKEKEHKSAAYLELNPNGKIPTMIDGEFVLWESMAITSYLAKKSESSMAGKNVQEEANIMKWNLWALAELQKPAIDWFIQEVFVPAEKRDQKIIEAAQEKLPPLLQALDKSLRNQAYLVGNRFTVADLNVASVVSILLGLRYDISGYAETARWMNQIKDRPAYQKYLSLRKN
jgi:glutathione S-transferase